MEDRQRSLERSEIAISRLLRAGVMLSGLIIAFGWASSLFEGPEREARLGERLSTLRSGAEIAGSHAPSSVSEFLARLPVLDSSAWIALGLIVLICLPILRVALTLYLFLRQKDHVFVGIACFVLTLLVISTVIGKTI